MLPEKSYMFIVGSFYGRNGKERKGKERCI